MAWLNVSHHGIIESYAFAVGSVENLAKIATNENGPFWPQGVADAGGAAAGMGTIMRKSCEK